jgi:tetraacyldisaccharide 4'-kinase
MSKRLGKLEQYFQNLVTLDENDPNLDFGTRLLLFCLKRLSHLYLAIIQLRLFLYAKGVFRHHTLGCQVISIGNLTVGGTGKTPVVEIFARELQKEGRRVAILSRGYKKENPPLYRRIIATLNGRKTHNYPRVVSDGKSLLLNSAMSGDEPYMLASNLPDVCVLVDKNRVRSGRYAISRLGCDTLILDDGFQYLALRHRVEIVLVDRTNPFGNGYLLPRGLLREPVTNIKRANYIFITKCEPTGAPEIKAKLKKMNPNAEIIECCHSPRYLKNVYSSEKLELAWLQNRKIVALSGIAAPAGFENELSARGAKIVEKIRFEDHHRYTQQEIIEIINKSKTLGAEAIITTEKDAVRFPLLERCDVPIYFLRVDIEIITGAEDFKSCIKRICFKDMEKKTEPSTTSPEKNSAT